VEAEFELRQSGGSAAAIGGDSRTQDAIGQMFDKVLFYWQEHADINDIFGPVVVINDTHLLAKVLTDVGADRSRFLDKYAAFGVLLHPLEELGKLGEEALDHVGRVPLPIGLLDLAEIFCRTLQDNDLYH
jgi:hypothetical protein